LIHTLPFDAFLTVTEERTEEALTASRDALEEVAPQGQKNDIGTGGFKYDW